MVMRPGSILLLSGNLALSAPQGGGEGGGTLPAQGGTPRNGEAGRPHSASVVTPRGGGGLRPYIFWDPVSPHLKLMDCQLLQSRR